MGAQPLAFCRRAHAEPCGEVEGERHADRHAFAVQESVGVAGGCLECMAEGMAEIQQSALTGLTLIARHNVGLHPAGTRYRMHSCRAVTRDRGRSVALQPIEKLAVAERSVLYDLRVTAQELAPRQ